MPTQVIFDMTEPDTKALIDGWADNTEYEVMVRLKTGAGENRNVAQALEVTEESMEREAEPEEAAPTPTPPVKPAKSPGAAPANAQTTTY